jgi:hypothetical protein
MYHDAQSSECQMLKKHLTAMDAGKLNCRVKTDCRFLVDAVTLYTKAPARADIQRGDTMDTT